MAYYSYDASSKQLIAVSDFQLPVPENGSCAEVEGVTKEQLESVYTWNSNECSFELRNTGRILTKLDYMNRFTDTELATIYTVAKTNVAVEIWLEKFKLSTEINLDDQRTIYGVLALEQFGLIGVGRASEILA